MARAKKPVKKTSENVPKWRISEDWLATAVGLAIILIIRLGEVSVEWPLFEWFKK
jgi:hypothetical protein